MKNRGIKILVWLGGITVCMIVVLYVIGSNSPDITGDAFYAAHHAVERRLKIPDSAVFESRYTEGNNCTRLPDGTYIAYGNVTSQNAFGVMIPSSWVVVLHRAGGAYSFDHTAIGDDEVRDFWSDIYPLYNPDDLVENNI